MTYIYSGQVTEAISQAGNIKDSAALFGLEALRFLTATGAAIFVGYLLVKIGVVNQQMAKETWIAPILDFFKRYGVKLALVLLLLIGFFRISDIIAGVISNVFYQDLNFSKEQIAEAVKIYGVLFSLVGGFLGGLFSTAHQHYETHVCWCCFGKLYQFNFYWTGKIWSAFRYGRCKSWWT